MQLTSRRACSAAMVSLIVLLAASVTPAGPDNQPTTPGSGKATRTYKVELKPLVPVRPILADWPEYVEPIRADAHFEGPILIDESGADLDVRAWHFSFNARGIIEIPNRIRADRTAIIVVHPWGIGDGQGWEVPEPAGFAFGTPENVRLTAGQIRRVINPFLKAHRGKVKLIAYSLPGGEDPIRRKAYRSIRRQPTESERQQGLTELSAKLRGFSYKRAALPEELILSRDRPVVSYFGQFPCIEFGDKYNGPGYWKLPIPVHRGIDMAPADVVIYDDEGYKELKGFLHAQGIAHVLLCGYHTDLCVRSTTAGHDNLSKDFNVFLVGDAMGATFASSTTPAAATKAALCYDARHRLITQDSWIKPLRRTAP